MSVKLNYEKYISSSSKWKTICAQIRNRDDNKCRLCDSTEKLHVHHLTYERLGNERLQDLVTLCELCHSDQHKLANTIRINNKRLKGDKDKSIRQAWAATKSKLKQRKKRKRSSKKQAITLTENIKPSKLIKLVKKFFNCGDREAIEILNQELKRRKIKSSSPSFRAFCKLTGITL